MATAAAFHWRMSGDYRHADTLLSIAGRATMYRPLAGGLPSAPITGNATQSGTGGL